MEHPMLYQHRGRTPRQTGQGIGFAQFHALLSLAARQPTLGRYLSPRFPAPFTDPAPERTTP